MSRPDEYNGKTSLKNEPGGAAPGFRLVSGGSEPPAGQGGDAERADPPLLSLTLWPNRSLSPRGCKRFLTLLAAGLAIPVVPLLGTPVGWVLLPFVGGMLLAVYIAFRRSYFDGKLVEELRLWPDLITVERREPRGAVRRWQANPVWVQLRLFDDAKIENYLTLRGNGREIELGAFLSPEERQRLYRELLDALGSLRGGGCASPVA